MASYGNRIIKNTIEFSKLMTQRIPLDYTVDELYLFLQGRASLSCSIMMDTLHCTTEYLQPLFDCPQKMSEDQAKGYSDLAKGLYDQKYPLDMDTSLRVHKALLERARFLNDIDEIIEELYWIGLINMLFYKGMFIEESEQSFQEVIETYKDCYLDIEKKETRLFYLKCLTNCFVTISMKRHIEGYQPEEVFRQFTLACKEATDFWKRKDVLEKDPDFPWEGLQTNLWQNTVAWMDMLRGSMAKDAGLAWEVYHSVCLLSDIRNEEDKWISGKKHWKNSRLKYLYYTSLYHIGEISLVELIQNLNNMIAETDSNQYTSENIYSIMFVSGVLMHYLGLDEKENGTNHLEEKCRLVDHVSEYYQNAPDHFSEELKGEIDEYLIDFFQSFTEDFECKDKVLELLLKVTSFSHLPTYVHSVMVSIIMECIANYFIEYKPEVFLGVCGTKNIQDVQTSKGDILDIVRLAGYAHDAGKIKYIKTVSLYSRKLSDREFKIIREHSFQGHEMMKMSVPQPVLDVILGHHKWYDGHGGYPDTFDNRKSDYKFIIDLCSIADSIDAATDELSRCYAPAKTLQTVLGEIQKMAGKNYSPVIAKMLEEECLIQELEEILQCKRKEIYFDAYHQKFVPIPSCWQEQFPVI